MNRGKREKGKNRLMVGFPFYSLLMINDPFLFLLRECKSETNPEVCI